MRIVLWYRQLATLVSLICEKMPRLNNLSTAIKKSLKRVKKSNREELRMIREYEPKDLPRGELNTMVLNELHRHSIERPFVAEDFAEKYGIAEVRVRMAIRELRLDHIRICSDPKHRGYWLEENGGGYEVTRKQMLSRAFRLLEVVKAMDNNQDGQLEWAELLKEVS